MTVNEDQFDPISLEVLRYRLEGIAGEMQLKLIRGSFSSIVKEGYDASVSLLTPQGETLAQAIAVPGHLAMMVPMAQSIIRTFHNDINEGDIFIHNDPYDGGTHLPDICILVPIFHDGSLIGFSGAITHHQDVGGMMPGSVPTNSTEIYQEGLRIPALKLYAAGKRNETLFALFGTNIRMPETFLGDLSAQVATCKLGSRRLRDAMAEHSHLDTINMFDVLLDRSEKMTRAAIRKLPDGIYHHVDYLDNDGVVMDKPIRIEVTITIDGDSFHCDLTGSSDQVKGPFNCVPSASLSAACFALRALTDPSIPSNGGALRPITLTLPEGSIADPKMPAPVACRTSTIKRITSSMIAAMKDVLPTKIPADSAGQMLLLTFGGIREDGSRYIVGEIIAAGTGASAARDGVDVVDTDVTNCMNMSIESMEQNYPIRVHSIALRMDSGGAGEYRGGLGVRKEYELLEGTATVIYRGERHNSQAQGSSGGCPGAKAACYMVFPDGTQSTLPSKFVMEIKKGDRLIVETAGGAGFGDPRKRSKENILLDIENRKISSATAWSSQIPASL